MALIRNAKPRKVSGGYRRIFGDEQIGLLISKVQSAVISSGTELEGMIRARTVAIQDLDAFLQNEIMAVGVFVANKSDIKNCRKLIFSASEPDFIIFRRHDNKQRCHVIELKDGDSFDTKKAAAERQAMHAFVNENGKNLPYIVSVHFCCFNQNNRSEIVSGFKNKINYEEALTGREFCALLDLDYDELVMKRQASVAENLPYFLSELVQIEVVRDWLKNNFRP